MRLIREFPVFAIVLGASAALMIIPALHGVRLEHWSEARSFLYHAIFTMIFALMLGLAMRGRAAEKTTRSGLFDLISIFLFLPVAQALPVLYLEADMSPVEAYFDALSSLTTTGASVMDGQGPLNEPVLLWHASIGWLGGFIMLVSAMSVLEITNLFQFEGLNAPRRLKGDRAHDDPKWLQHSLRVLPPYIAATAILALLLIVAGERTFVAVCQAMATLSTSGINPLLPGATAASAHIGEAMIAIFLVLALSGNVITLIPTPNRMGALLRDAELKLALALVGSVTLILFLRHFIDRSVILEAEEVPGALHALWGIAFTALSFLSTHGQFSMDWDIATGWSALENPGIILMGMCIMGGGVATTAGGVKLLRIYALIKHGQREMERLIHPSSIGGDGITLRHLRRHGAHMAWLILMLFFISIAATMVALTFTGIGFEAALGLAVAALSNTGPALGLIDQTTAVSTLGSGALMVLSAAMILGRLEIIVVIALLHPRYWQQ